MSAVSPERFDAVLFDLDGVLTTTDRLHARVWKRALDELLDRWDARVGTETARFSLPEDYLRHLDGRPRLDGLRAFLASRDISLPEGRGDAPTDELSVHGVGNRKQQLVDQTFRDEGVEAFPGSVAWLRELRDEGIKTGVVTPSRNCERVLTTAGIDALFDVRVDGVVAAREDLATFPDPSMLEAAAARLEVEPPRVVVVGEAPTTIEAATAGGFGMVIGVDRAGRAEELADAGADVVVEDLGELLSAVGTVHHPAGPPQHRVVAGAQRLLAAEGDYPIEPFRIVERAYNPRYLPQTETIFAVGNGYLGIRGSFEEGHPKYRPHTLLNGFHETWPISYGEAAYGFAKTGQTIVPVPDGTIVRLYVDDEPFDCERNEVLEFERALDMEAGTMDRTVVFPTPDGRRFRVRSRRLVSFEHRHLSMLWYEVTCLDAAASITLVSELGVWEEAPDDGPDDPRRAEGLGEGVLESLGSETSELRVTARARTRSSGLVVACGMDHDVDSVVTVSTQAEASPLGGRVALSADVPAGRSLTIVKYLAYHHDDEARSADLAFRVRHTLDRARSHGPQRIFISQRDEVRDFWQRSDVRAEGAPLVQQAVRFNLYELFQASARVEGLGVPAKGVTGSGYEGHYFWDTEIFQLPFLVYTAPWIARSLLLHRFDMLDAARARAREVGQRGALFPWRTISGEEASAYYAAGTAQYHINADIAYAIEKYVNVTGDEEFLARYGAEILVETARLWADLGFFSHRKGGRFVINGVTGPDEYTTVVDNNAYTNLMARKNLRAAADTVDWLEAERPGDFRALGDRTGLSAEEVRSWRRAAELMYLPYDDHAKVHLQDDGFLDREVWDFESTPADKYPLLLHFHPLVIYRHQVIKQADLTLAAFLLGDRFTLEEKRRIFEYYDPLTTGDSTLSESIQSIVAAEVGDLRAAEEYFIDAVGVDLADIAGNVRDGIHVASAGGTWMALVSGFGGMRDHGGELTFRPALPSRLTLLGFTLRVQHAVLDVEITHDAVTYRLREGEQLSIRHYDEPIELGERHVVVRPVAEPDAEREEDHTLGHAASA